MLVVLWALIIAVIVFAPLYFMVLRPHLKMRRAIRLRIRIRELREQIKIEEAIREQSTDSATSIKCENMLFALNDRVFFLESQLAK